MEITQDKDYQTQAARIILSYFEKMMSLERGTLQGQDIEYLHDMRVSSRRLRARLEDFAVLFPSSKYQWIQKQIRRMTRQLGRARDIDVLEDFLKQDCRPAPGVPPAILRAVARLREERRKKLGRFLRRQHRKGNIRAIQRYLNSKSKQSPPKTVLREYMVAFASRVIQPRLQAVEHYFPYRFLGSRGLADIHALRIQAKKLRYSMEIFEALFGNEFGELIKNVRGLQDAAGRVHDSTVFKEHLLDFVQEGVVTREVGAPLLQHCAVKQKEALLEFRRVWKQIRSLNLPVRLHDFWSNTAGHTPEKPNNNEIQEMHEKQIAFSV